MKISPISGNIIEIETENGTVFEIYEMGSEDAIEISIKHKTIKATLGNDFDNLMKEITRARFACGRDIKEFYKEGKSDL